MIWGGKNIPALTVVAFSCHGITLISIPWTERATSIVLSCEPLSYSMKFLTPASLWNFNQSQMFAASFLMIATTAIPSRWVPGTGGTIETFEARFGLNSFNKQRFSPRYLELFCVHTNSLVRAASTRFCYNVSVNRVLWHKIAVNVIAKNVFIAKCPTVEVVNPITKKLP